MKRMLMSFVVLAAVAFTFSACKSGPKLLSEEEKAKKIEEMVDAEMEALTAELDAECETNFEQYIQEAVDSIVTAQTTPEEN